MQEGKMRRQFTWKDERKGLLAYSSCDGLMAKILPMTDNGRDIERAHTPPNEARRKGMCTFFANGCNFQKNIEINKKIYIYAKELYSTHLAFAFR